eukprot:763969-Hanusia_phi.AAC.2
MQRTSQEGSEQEGFEEEVMEEVSEEEQESDDEEKDKVAKVVDVSPRKLAKMCEESKKISTIGVLGGEWKFDNCILFASGPVTAVRTSSSALVSSSTPRVCLRLRESQVTLQRCDIGGDGNESRAHTALTTIHR